MAQAAVKLRVGCKKRHLLENGGLVICGEGEPPTHSHPGTVSARDHDLFAMRGLIDEVAQ